jgi:hypothetical protein
VLLLVGGVFLVGGGEIFVLEVGFDCSTLCFMFGPEVNEFLIGSFACKVEGLVRFVMKEG